MRSFTSREKPISRTLDSQSNASASNIQKSAIPVMQLDKWKLTKSGWEPLDGATGYPAFKLKNDKGKFLGKIYNSETKSWEDEPVEAKAPLAKDDFYLTGITKSAVKGRGTEDGVIARFENAVKSGNMTWRSFKGDTHHTVDDPLGGATFKAHFYDGRKIKLYIDQSQGANSKHRAIYTLNGTALEFTGFEEHK